MSESLPKPPDHCQNHRNTIRSSLENDQNTPRTIGTSIEWQESCQNTIGTTGAPLKWSKRCWNTVGTISFFNLLSPEQWIWFLDLHPPTITHRERPLNCSLFYPSKSTCSRLHCVSLRLAIKQANLVVANNMFFFVSHNHREFVFQKKITINFSKEWSRIDWNCNHIIINQFLFLVKSALLQRIYGSIFESFFIH